MQKLPSVAEQENQIYECNFSTDYPCTHLVVDLNDRVYNLPHILEHETLHKANGGRRSRGIPSLVLRRYEQIYSSTDPQTQHLSSWLFEHWSCAISSTTHVSTILENPPFRADEERNDNSRYRISQALFSLTSSKTPLSLPVSHTSLIHRSSTLVPQKHSGIPQLPPRFYLHPKPHPFSPELGKSPNALVSGCFLNTCSISYSSHLRINEPTTRCNESPSRTSAFPSPSPFPKPLPPLPPPYSSKNSTANRNPPPPPFPSLQAQNQDPPATTIKSQNVDFPPSLVVHCTALHCPGLVWSGAICVKKTQNSLLRYLDT